MAVGSVPHIQSFKRRRNIQTAAHPSCDQTDYTLEVVLLKQIEEVGEALHHLC